MYVVLFTEEENGIPGRCFDFLSSFLFVRSPIKIAL